MDKYGRRRLLKQYNPKNKLLMAEPWINNAKTVNELMLIKDEVSEATDKLFTKTWDELKEMHKDPIILWEGKVDEKNLKRIMVEAVRQLAKYVLYGRLYEIAKFDLDDEFENRAVEYDKEKDQYYFNKKAREGMNIAISGEVLFVSELIVAVWRGNYEKLQEIIIEHENKYGKYDKRLFKEAFKIQRENKGKRPKITDEDAIVLANQRLNIQPAEELINNDGQKTLTLLNITKTYSNYHKPLLRKEAQ